MMYLFSCRKVEPYNVAFGFTVLVHHFTLNIVPKIVHSFYIDPISFIVHSLRLLLYTFELNCSNVGIRVFTSFNFDINVFLPRSSSVVNGFDTSPSPKNCKKFFGPLTAASSGIRIDADSDCAMKLSISVIVSFGC